MARKKKQARAVHKEHEFDPVAAGVAALVALILYIRTLAPTVSVEDTGELIAAAYTLGIPHPTGYPLWCLLAKLFIVLVPFGDVAWRANLSSAVFASGTVALVGGMTGALTRNRLAGIAAGLTLAFSWEFWEQAVIAEVYTLNAFLMMLCIFLLFRWERTQRRAQLYAFAFTYGLSLCNHSTAFLLAPVFLLFILGVEPRVWRMGRPYVIMAALVALGLCAYLYLPLRSRANPAMDWGNPETWQGFWDVFTRKQYQFIITDKSRGFTRFMTQSWAYIRILGAQFTPWVGMLSLFGVVTVWRADRLRCAFLVAVFLVVSIGSILIPNFDLDRQSIWLNTTYWIPAYVIAAMFIGFGIDRIATRFLYGQWRRRVAVALGFVCVASPFIANYARCDKSDYYFARDYATNLFETMEKDAIYFGTPDHSIFPLVYLQVVEGIRPDITIANKYGYPDPVLYADMPEVIKSRFDRFPNELERSRILNWVVRHTSRPVYFARMQSFGAVPGKKVASEGLLYKVVNMPEARTPVPWNGWDTYTWHTLDVADTHGDWTADLILYDYHFARGRWYLEQGQTDEGIRSFECALACAGEDKEWLNDVANACAEYGLYEAAVTYFQRALAMEPDYGLALKNLARVYMRRQRYELAVPLLEKTVRNYRADVPAYWLLSRCLVRLGRIDEAITRLESLTVMTPYDAALYRRLGLLYWQEKQDGVAALPLLRRSLELDPEQRDLAGIVHDISNLSPDPRTEPPPMPLGWESPH